MFFVFTGMLMMALSGTVLGTGTSEEHNHEEHATLCNLLGAAVHKWQRKHNPATKKVLAQAIFGNQTGGSLDELRKSLPSEYNAPGNRDNWCGTCTHSDGKIYPGSSIPHDLICMCTVGSGGYPFTHKSDTNGRSPTLCGKGAEDLGCKDHQNSGNGCHGQDNNHWWNSTIMSNEPNGQVKEHLSATWEKVVKPCLRGRSHGKALETLLRKLKVEEQQTPSWARGHISCNGFSGAVCVNYGHQCGREHNNNSPQWWETLYEALTAPEDTRAKEKSTRYPRNRNRRKTGGAPTPEEPEDDIEEEESEQTESESTNNHPLALLSNQQSGTSLPPPHSWFLGPMWVI